MPLIRSDHPGSVALRAITRAFLLAALMGCQDKNPEGYLELCQTNDDCDSSELECAHVPNHFSGFISEERYCTLRCTSNSQCPELTCSEWVGTDLECLQSAISGGTCGTGQIGDVSLQVCGM